MTSLSFKGVQFDKEQNIHRNIFQTDGKGMVVNNLSQYVHPEVTPQNAILWAYRKEPALIES